MKANEIRDWIDSLTQDIDFEYQNIRENSAVFVHLIVKTLP